MKKIRFERRKLRTRIKLFGTGTRPRLSVFKSNKFVSVQAIDDSQSKTLISISEKQLGKLGELGKDGIAKSKELGKMIAEKLLKIKIKKAVFDKGGYQYHGKVKAVAEGAREGGLEF